MKRVLAVLIAVAPMLASANMARKPGVSSTGASSVPITAPRFDITDQDWEYWVDLSTGSDTNPGSEAAPFATLAKAIDSLPDRWRGKCRIHMSSGTDSYIGETHLRIGAPEGADAEICVIQGTMEDSGLGTRTITGVTLWTGSRVYEIEDDTLTPTLDQYEGYWLRMTSGDAEGMRRIVRGNSTGGNFELNIGYHSSTGPQVGDTFVIERPATVIEFDNYLIFESSSGVDGGKGNRSIGLSKNVVLGLHQLRFEGQDATSYLTLSGIGVAMQTIYQSGGSYNGMFVTAGSHVESGISVPGLADSDGLFNNIKRYGDGIYMEFSAYSVNGMMCNTHASFQGALVARNAKVWGRFHSDLYFTGIDIDGGKIEAETQTELMIGHASFGPLNRVINSPDYGIQFIDSRSPFIHDLEVSNSAADGIHASTQCYVFLGDITGTGNGECGYRSEITSSAYLYGSVSISGSTGEVCFGDTDSHQVIMAWSDIATAKTVTDSAHGVIVDPS